MASHSYPEPQNCFDTMQNFFQNIFGSGRDNDSNNNNNANGSSNANGNGNGNGDNANNSNASTAGRASRFGRSQPRQARRAASGSSGSSSRSSHRREAAGANPSSTSTSAPASASASASASSSQQRTRPRPAAESEAAGAGAAAGAQEGRHNLSPFEFLAEAFGHGLTREQFYAAAQQAAQEAGMGAGMAGQQGQGQGQQGPQPNPPASCKAIRQLPTVIVKPEDLVDENNRECCICFEALNIGDRATRLPCAHIYHPRCVIQWLGSHSNTCPVCRYELPTENDIFERGREERMKLRKPRYAPYELYRMNIKDLKELCQKISLDPNDYMEKKEMVRAILESGRVEVIAAPEPVEYPSIGVLRSMGIRQLKNAMADAGVFFDPKDVVEKEDMVQIFVSSGRILLLEEESGGEDDDDDDGDQKMSSNNAYTTATDYDYGHAPRDESDIKRARLSSNDLDAYEHSTSMHENEDVDEDDVASSSLNVSQGEGSIMSITANESGSESDPLLQDVDVDVENDESSMNDNGQQQQQQREPLTTTPAVETTASATASNVQNSSHAVSTPTSTPAPEASTGITTRSVKELRRLAQELNVDISGCLEKREMIDLITANLGNNR